MQTITKQVTTIEEQHLKATIHTILIPLVLMFSTGAILNGFLWIGFMSLIYLKSDSVNKKMFYIYAFMVSFNISLLTVGLYVILNMKG